MSQLAIFIQRPIVSFVLVWIGSFILLKSIKYILTNRLKKLAALTSNHWDGLVINAIDQIGWPFYWAVPTYVASHFASLPTSINRFVQAVILVVVTYYIVRVFQIVVGRTIRSVITKKKQNDPNSQKTISIFLETIAKVVIWTVAIILILQNLGYKVSALLGGLGVAGIAVGFALQNVLADIFAFFSLYFDRPFEVGDFIVIDQDSGTVDKIGIKSTRLTTLQGQELVVSNKELTEHRVHNYKKMDHRRVVFNFGVTYDTPVSKLKKINQIMQQIMDQIEQAELTRIHFHQLGESSLNYEVVYKVLSSDYTQYMDIQQTVNLELMDRFHKEKIEFAYPTQTILMTKSK